VIGAGEAVGGLALVLPFALGLAQVPDGPGAREVFTFTDPEVVESSGLVVEGRIGSGDALVATVNDSGDTARVFVVDPATGDTVGTTSYAAATGGEPVDVEALAPGLPGRLWVADIGDNPGTRDELLLYDVPVGRGAVAVDPEPLRVGYPDGPHDAESLLRHPRTGRLLLVTKGVLGGIVHALPRGAAPGDEVVTEPVGRVLGLATDAAFFPDGRHLVVRNYSIARVYRWPGLEEVGALPLPSQPQGEGIAVDAAGRVLLSSEGLREPVLGVPLPPALESAMAGPGQRPTRSEGTDAAAEVEESGDPSLRGSWPWGVGIVVAAGAGWLVVRSRRR
jgi:hypothetical protein